MKKSNKDSIEKLNRDKRIFNTVTFIIMIIGAVLITNYITIEKVQIKYINHGFELGEKYVWQDMKEICLEESTYASFEIDYWFDEVCVMDFCSIWCDKHTDSSIYSMPTQYVAELKWCNEDCFESLEDEEEEGYYYTADKIGCLKTNTKEINKTICNKVAYTYKGGEKHAK